VRETEILVEQQTPHGVFVCDHAGLVINKLSGEEARRRPPTTAELLHEGKKKRRFLRAVKREGETFLRRFATGNCPGVLHSMALA